MGLRAFFAPTARSTVPFTSSSLFLSAPPCWDYDPACISPDARLWAHQGTASAYTLFLAGSAYVDPSGGPNGRPCVSLSNYDHYEAAGPLPLTGAAARTHLVIFQTQATNRVELMGWGSTEYFGALYDSMVYGTRLIQHFYGYEVYSAGPVQPGAWSCWLVRGQPRFESSLLLDMWLNSEYSSNIPDAGTTAAPLRLGSGHYSDVPDERRIARVLIWDRALTDDEINQLQAWVLATYGLPC
jgi:hypothetical protein